MIEINELSDEVMTDAEISNRVSALIESAYPAGRELKIMRRYLANPADEQVKLAFDAYNADVEAIRSVGSVARDKAALVRAAIEVEAADVLLLTGVDSPEVSAAREVNNAASPEVVALVRVRARARFDADDEARRIAEEMQNAAVAV